jgi:hypothetical protein
MAIVDTTVCRKLEAMYHSRAELARRARVTGRIAGETLRNCEVLTFALPDHPEASCCYVWETDGRVHIALDTEDPDPERWM